QVQVPAAQTQDPKGKP
nr:NADP-malate dehydrogenase 38 kda monomer, NADP-MDH {N-terminal} {EC 1.1.1.82} [Pisum sativum=peas, cv. Kleine Rheinlanderin, leaves, Peptide Chloroplast Partial, 16 aa] [Pisum sativum]